MLDNLRDSITPTKTKSLAGAFKRLGWAGFWLQVVFGSLPIIMMVYYFTFSRSATGFRNGLAFVEYLTLANLVLLAFTIFWSYRYTRLAKQIKDPAKPPTQASIIGTVWTGVVVGAIGMIFSMTVIFIEVANLLFYFLKAPQAGMPVIQTSGAEGMYLVSSVDMVSLMSLVLILFAEVIVLVFSLSLLFRSSQGSAEYPQSTAK